jgi:hypothetical protein
VPRISDRSIRCGRRLLLVAALFALVLAVVPTGALAQRVVPEVPPVRVPGGGGTGGGAGLLPPMPTLRSAPSVTPAPNVVPAAPAAPVTVAPAVRFRCQLEPGAEACKEPTAPDGGGGDGECNCAVDACYDDPAGFRVCEKR